MDVRNCKELSYGDFVSSYMAPNIPVLIEVQHSTELCRAQNTRLSEDGASCCACHIRTMKNGGSSRVM